MKINFFTLLLAIFVSASATAHEGAHSKAADNHNLDSPAAKAVLAFRKALETGDAAAAIALLGDNLTVYEGGNVERSAAEYASHHLHADIKYLLAVDTKVIEQQVQVIGNTAISISRSQTSGTYKGKVRDHEGMETLVLEKQGEQWKIIHIHWS